MSGVLVETVLHHAAPIASGSAFRLSMTPGPGILSMEAIADPPAYQRARAAVRFDEISRALVHGLKYGDRLDLAPMMGRLDQPCRARASGRGRRARSRCRCIGAACGRGGSTNPPCLPPRSPTESGVPVAARARSSGSSRLLQQVGLSRTERAANIQGAFRVPPEGRGAVAGRRLVLVDDVLTSGRHGRTVAPARCCGPVPPMSTC